MPKSNESFGDRFRKITLLQWGGICIAGAAVSGAASLAQPAPKNTAEAAGRASAVLLFVVIGVVLMIIHFVRPKRGGGKPSAKPKRPQGAPTAANPPGMPPRRPGAKRP